MRSPSQIHNSSWHNEKLSPDYYYSKFHVLIAFTFPKRTIIASEIYCACRKNIPTSFVKLETKRLYKNVLFTQAHVMSIHFIFIFSECNSWSFLSNSNSWVCGVNSMLDVCFFTKFLTWVEEWMKGVKRDCIAYIIGMVIFKVRVISVAACYRFRHS